jgi:hypothetical protein
MTNRYGRKVLRATVVLALATAALVCLLAACNNSGSYTLTIDGVNCTTTPSGSTVVLPGAITAIKAVASLGHTMPGSSVWTVVSGSPSIADPNSASTSVTLNLGDATIQANCP